MVDQQQGRRADLAIGEASGSGQGGAARPGEASRPPMSGEDREFQRAMELGRKVMIDHHAVLAVLAK